MWHCVPIKGLTFYTSAGLSWMKANVFSSARLPNLYSASRDLDP